MANFDKTSRLWVVNIISFLLLCVLSFTGLVNWLLLPRGPASGGGFLISLRHFLRDVHEWASVGFIIALAIHLYLHWGYIKSNLKRSGLLH